jgi:hypothetical protein
VRIEPSHFDSATVYVAFDNHRVNDLDPYLYVSTDFGKTFRSIVANLPKGGPDFLHVVREDPHNRDLLFVGSDVGVYTSLDRGRSWHKLMTGLPTVPVHDLEIHPRERELIAGTHGRSIWIVDIAPLEQMTDSARTQVAHLFAPKTAFQFGEPPLLGEDAGHKAFEAPSVPYGAEITYRLTSGAPRERAKILISDVRGDTVTTLEGPGTAGLHRVYWDFRTRAVREPRSPAQRRDSVEQARKVNRVLDSLATAGMPRSALDRVRTMVASGEGFGAIFGGGRRTGRPGQFVERPGEGPPPRPRGGPAARRDTAARADTGAAARTDTIARGARTAEGPGGEERIDPDLAREIVAALRAANAIPAGGGFAGRRPPPPVASGDYLITMTVGGRTLRQVLRVEKTSNGMPVMAAN